MDYCNCHRGCTTYPSTTHRRARTASDSTKTERRNNTGEEVAEEYGREHRCPVLPSNVEFSGVLENDPKVVSRELKKLKSESAKYNAVKENIMIRVKGFGWEWCKHAWSKDGRKYTVFELAKHLQMIIKKEKSLEVPNERL
jgi:hypothetical protein